MALLAPDRTTRRAAIWAAAVIWLTVGYFQHTRMGWNVASRFGLTLALAEHGTFTIDDYQENAWTFTNDKAFFDGHYYSDKSPVTSFAAVPIVWIYRQLSLRLGIPFHREYSLWIATWLIVGGSAAALAGMLTLLFAERGVTPRRAAAGGALWVAATPLLGYAVVFYDYLPACALLAAAFLTAEPWWRDRSQRTPSRLLAAGILCGLACWTLNTLGIAALTLTVLIVAGTVRRERATAIPVRLLPWAVGGLIGAAGFFVYNYALFHSLRPAYAFEAEEFFRESMAHGLMGAGWPRPIVIWLQTVHPFQGLLLWFPVIAFATLGCAWIIARQRGADRREALMALATFVLFLAYSSGYYMWWGGRSGYAPRHVIPALTLLPIGLIPWTRTTKLEPWIWTMFAAAALFNLTTAAVDPQYPIADNQLIFLRPEVALDWPPPLLQMERTFWSDAAGWNSHVALWNIGRQLGLEGPASMLPLLAVWATAFMVLPRWLSEPGVEKHVRQPGSRRRIVAGGVLAACSVWLLAAAVLWRTAPSVPIVKVRWVADIAQEQRVHTERELSLVLKESEDRRTSSYFLTQPDQQHLSRIVQHPFVEDTAFIDRGSFTLNSPRYERLAPATAFGMPWLTWSVYASLLGFMAAAVVLAL